MAKRGPKLGANRKPNSVRFWAKVNKNGPVPSYRPELGACWLWTGCISQDQPKCKGGYGRFWISVPDSTKYKQVMAHRYAYELENGTIPEGKEPDHLCRVRSCIRPSHLEPVTRQENILRGYNPQAINARKKTCSNGHPLSGNNMRMEGNSRRCRKCARAAQLRWEAKQRKTS